MVLLGIHISCRLSGSRLLTEGAAPPARRKGLEEREKSRPLDLNAQAALGTFVVVVIAALIFYLALGHRQWFHADEWDFIAVRTGGNFGDLFRPHNEHWSTLPIIVFRLLWRIGGLHTYFPFLLSIVSLHLTVACLLRTVMRRAGVSGWTATVAASLFVFFGAGYDNIVYAFQIGFVGALALGLTHLLLADHDGPISRSDWVGLAVGFAALLCSGVAVTMVAVVGLATLLRRGWRVALFHVAPLAGVYVAWLGTVARSNYSRPAGMALVVRFTATDLRATFGALGQVLGVGVLLGAALVVGLILAWRPPWGKDARKRISAPAALLVGAVVFLVITGLGRAGAPSSSLFRQPATASRYLHIVAALLLPALAVAVDAIARRLGKVGVIAVAAMLVGIPGNIGDVRRNLDDTVPAVRIYREAILAIPRLPVSTELPRTYQPFLPFVPGVTIGWILDSAASGRLPRSGSLALGDVSRLTLGLVVHQSSGLRRGPCDAVIQATVRRVTRGDSIEVGPGRVAIAYVSRGAATLPVIYGSLDERVVLEIITGPVSLRLEPAGRSRVDMCGPDHGSH